MNELEKLRSGLAEIHVTFKADSKTIDEALKEILEAEQAIGLTPWKRVEGYALVPSREAAVIGLPHLRIARSDDLMTIWVRAPYALDGGLCREVELDVEELYNLLLKGALQAVEVLKKHLRKDDVLQVSLP